LNAVPLARIAIAHAPTPLQRAHRLDAIVGCEVWLKRDDMTGGPEAGNKVRKLELLLADALARGAVTVLTCGGIQSNHARATALACAALGLRCVLFLRVSAEEATGADRAAPHNELPNTGNVLLDRLAGAELRLISPSDYAARAAVMDAVALELKGRGESTYIIPEGGSNGLGSLGYVEAMRELRVQMDLGLGGAPKRFDRIALACGSGGTAAGVALGVARYQVADEALAFAVCDDRAYFERVVGRIVEEARGIDPTLEEPARLSVDDTAKGPAYGVMSPEQTRFLVETARRTGIVTDPVYTGKALFGLAQAARRGDLPASAKVLFIHTGGLPGLLAQGPALALELA
jgi:D-cysteine desulfhydrase